jgi:uncharacterized protein
MIRKRTFAGVAVAVMLALAPDRPASAQETDQLGAVRARQLYLDGQPDKAFAMLLPLAEAGDAQAMVTLGYFYAYGIGTNRDVAKAVTLFEAATKQNHPGALFNLAIFHEHGSFGLPKDLNRAHALLLQAASFDHPPSMLRLARLHLLANRLLTETTGIPRDPALGRALLERAVALGDRLAIADLAEELQTGTNMARDFPRARQLLLIVAAHGVREAQLDYAAMVEAGRGGVADLAEAELWYRRAQANGIADAALGLARILARDALPGRDRQVEALAWCLWYQAQRSVTNPDAALQNCAWARIGLGPEGVTAAQELAPTF